MTIAPPARLGTDWDGRTGGGNCVSASGIIVDDERGFRVDGMKRLESLGLKKGGWAVTTGGKSPACTVLQLHLRPSGMSIADATCLIAILCLDSRVMRCCSSTTVCSCCERRVGAPWD